jgi:ferredoxin
MYATNEFHSSFPMPYALLKERQTMAERNDRLAQNVPGRYYVDSTCIDCDMCRSTAPDFFKRDEEIGMSIRLVTPISMGLTLIRELFEYSYMNLYTVERFMYCASECDPLSMMFFHWASAVRWPSSAMI